MFPISDEVVSLVDNELRSLPMSFCNVICALCLTCILPPCCSLILSCVQYKLRMAAMSWFIGCLSFEQFSKLAVLSWPYAMRTLFVATEVMQQWEKSTEQRLQAGSTK